MAFSGFIAVVSAVWLIGCGAAILALYWNMKAGSKKWWASCILSAIALVIGYLGLTRIQFHASKTVNGHLEWSVNSQWFFIATVVLGAASLAWSVWNARKAVGRRAIDGSV